MSFELHGYRDVGDLGRTAPDWQTADRYPDILSATAAAIEWLGRHRAGLVQVFEHREAARAVVRVVTDAGIEEFATPWRESPRRKLAKWIGTPIGALLIGLVLLGVSILVILYPDAFTRRGTPEFTRKLGVFLTISMVGLIAVGVWATRFGPRAARRRRASPE